jgi:hypothetical protein
MGVDADEGFASLPEQDTVPPSATSTPAINHPVVVARIVSPGSKEV